MSLPFQSVVDFNNIRQRTCLFEDSGWDPFGTCSKLANHHILAHWEGTRLSVLVMLGNLLCLLLMHMLGYVWMNERKLSAKFSLQKSELGVRFVVA